MEKRVLLNCRYLYKLLTNQSVSCAPMGECFYDINWPIFLVNNEFDVKFSVSPIAWAKAITTS